jgi:hypothetical protein
MVLGTPRLDEGAATLAISPMLTGDGQPVNAPNPAAV